jgi:FKBP-type peptidyl-prolyl cis-trans isomerase FkpA
MMIAPDNEAADQKKQQEQYAKQMKEYQEQVAKTKKPLEGYEASAFDAKSVTELSVEVLKEGEGEKLASDSTISANYFGWTADGKIFDSTNTDGTVTPIDFGLNQVITGWTKGLTGVKVGSVVKLTIPAEQAYGSIDNGDGRPVGPLQFIVEVKEKK